MSTPLLGGVWCQVRDELRDVGDVHRRLSLLVEQHCLHLRGERIDMVESYDRCADDSLGLDDLLLES